MRVQPLKIYSHEDEHSILKHYLRTYDEQIKRTVRPPPLRTVDSGGTGTVSYRSRVRATELSLATVKTSCKDPNRALSQSFLSFGLPNHPEKGDDVLFGLFGAWVCAKANVFEVDGAVLPNENEDVAVLLVAV